MAKRGPRTTNAFPLTSGSAGQVRCAIYTRKSTEDGLEQEFNSLDAQREACAAYILSQRHEGWALLPDAYDDGGFSGGSMERPGLKQLLADVEQGRIDVIVVYKVDRLTRALNDFAKIVEVLDGKGASFVSVTQAFNTTTSMGRLTLNVLLSFAQFEREVTGERIRDKIAASKKKGMWMGGPVPLGYDVRDRRLVVNEAEAETVRLIFQQHQQAETLQALTTDLRERGVTSRRRVMRDGRVVGGHPYSSGALRYLLGNRIYVGEIRHGDAVYPGEHQPVVDRERWEASQKLLARNVPRPRSGQVSLLSQLLHDAHGRKMFPAHAVRSNRRYRYYVSRTTSEVATQPWRIPAGDLETLVVQALSELVSSPDRILAELGDAVAFLTDIRSRCRALAVELENPATCGQLLKSLQLNVLVEQDRLTIGLSAASLAAKLNLSHGNVANDQRISILVPASLRRRGHELRLVQSADVRPAKPDERLIQLLAAGRAAWRDLQKHSPADPVRRSHLTRMARLAFLAPDIVIAILEGRQPVELTSRALLRISALPMEWGDQRQVLGFG